MKLEEYPAVKQWLGNLAQSTQKINLYTMKYWLTWVGENGGRFAKFTPDDFIEFQINAETHKERYELLDLLQAWIIQHQGRVGYKLRSYATIRGFFARNLAELPRDPNFNIKSDKAKVVGSLTIEEVRDIIQNSNVMYKAASLIIFQGGMDTSSFEYWNTHGYKNLMDQLRQYPDIIKIDLPGRKKQRNKTPYYTLIGSDAIEALRIYLQDRPKFDSEVIFVNQYGNSVKAHNVQTYWRRLLKRRKFIDELGTSDPGNRYGKSIHELRDVFRTQWQKAPDRPAPEVGEFLMGHQVDNLDYNKAFTDVEWVKIEYQKALPMFQVMSSGAPFGRVEGSRIKELERRLQEAKNGQNDRVAELETQIAQLSKALTKVMEKLEESE